MNKLNQIKNFLSQLYKRLDKHDVLSYSAQSAYFLLLAFFPVIIMIIMFITVLGVENLDNIDKIVNFLPLGTKNMIKSYLSYSKNIELKIMSPFVLISIIIISSSAISSLAKAFNKANDIIETRTFFKRRLIFIVVMLISVIAFTFSLLLSTIGILLIKRILTIFQLAEINLRIFKITAFALNFLIYTSVIGLMYHVLPNKQNKIKKILPGTLFAAPSLAIITNITGYVINNFTKYSVLYGSLTSIIILLIWLFFCSLILIIGEEINAML